jgi:FeS assembly SUF system protein
MEPEPMEIDTSRLQGRPVEEAPATPRASPPLAPPALAAPLTVPAMEELRQAIINELRQCYDPEIPVNIYELGLIYGIDVQPNGEIHVRMTLTSPACPVAGSLPGEVKAKLCKLANVTAANVEVVWEPPWEKNLMSEDARLLLGIDD